MKRIGEVVDLSMDKILANPELKTMYDNEVKATMTNLLNEEAKKRAKAEEKEIVLFGIFLLYNETIFFFFCWVLGSFSLACIC